MLWETDERRQQKKNLGDWQLISEGKRKAGPERGQAAEAMHGAGSGALARPCQEREPTGELLLGLWAVRVVQELDWAGGELHTDQIRPVGEWTCRILHWTAKRFTSSIS